MLWARLISGMLDFNTTQGNIYEKEANVTSIEELGAQKEELAGQQSLNWRIMCLFMGLCCIIWVPL